MKDASDLIIVALLDLVVIPLENLFDVSFDPADHLIELSFFLFLLHSNPTIIITSLHSRSLKLIKVMKNYQSTIQTSK